MRLHVSLLFLHYTMNMQQTTDTMHTSDSQFVSDIIQIIRDGKDKAYAAVNASMIDTYWNVGRRIVLEEQKGELRAEYGTQLSPILSSIPRLRDLARARTKSYLDSLSLISGENREIFQIQQGEV